MGKYSDGKDGGSYPLVAVCIDKDKNSQNALKYATETLVHKGQTVILVHVNTKGTSGGVEDTAGYKKPTDPQMKDLFLPFRCFCTRKDIHSKDVVLDNHDVSKSIVEFAAHAAVEKLVVGATVWSGFIRFKVNIPSSISKMAPDFSTVYVISKGGKVSSVRQAIHQAPAVSLLRTMIQGPKPEHVPTQKLGSDAAGTPRLQDNLIMGLNASARKAFPDFSLLESSDISFIDADHRSVERYSCTPLLLSGSDGHDHHSFEATRTPVKWGESLDKESTSQSQRSSHPMEDMEAEMRRLWLELKQAMDMYSTACKEALSEKQKAMELQHWKMRRRSAHRRRSVAYPENWNEGG